jgi:hypothetical protein
MEKYDFWPVISFIVVRYENFETRREGLHYFECVTVQAVLLYCVFICLLFCLLIALSHMFINLRTILYRAEYFLRR